MSSLSTNFMNLNPPNNGQYLFNVGDNTKLFDFDTMVKTDELADREVHFESKNKHTIIIVIISAIIFMTIISIYDFIRNCVTVYYADIGVKHFKNNISQENIDQTLYANRTKLKVSLSYLIICTVLSLIIIPLLLFYKNKK